MRKLATAAISFSAAVFASNYLVPAEYYFIFAAAFASLSLSAVFLKNEKRTRALLVFLAAAAGFLICFSAYTYKALPARERFFTGLSMT